MGMAAAPAMPMPGSPPGAGWLNMFMGSSGAAGAAAKAGVQAVPSAIQGFGLGIGVRASGIVGKIFGWFAEMLTSWGPYDIFVKFAAIIYLIDIGTGFNPGITIPMHLAFAWIAFFVIGILDKKNLNLSVWTYVWVSIIFLYMFFVINNGVGFLTRLSVNILPLALALAFYFGMIPRLGSKVPMPLFGIPIVAAIDVFVLNIFRDRIIDLAGNFNFVAGGIAFLLGRLVNPLMVIYGAMFMYAESPKVAQKVFTILFIIYVTAALWSAFGHVAKLRGATGLTPEEISQGTNLLQTSARSISNLLTLKFLDPAITGVTGRLYETFGFGEPKEEPKLGLALAQDSTMLKKYDLSYKTPEPSFIMKITSPFPAGAEKPYIDVTNMECFDKLKKVTPALEFLRATTSRGITPTESVPVKAFYNGLDGGMQIKCSFDGWQAGDYTIAAGVDYKVDATAFLTTAFIRADQDEALRLQGMDPAILNKIPHADAMYDNVPVTLTWGPPDLTKSPASIDLGQPAAETDPGTQAPVTPSNMLITVYVSKNSGWETSDIKSVNNLALTVPSGVTLVGDACDFDISKPTIKEGGVTEYNVKEDRIIKAVTDENGEVKKAPRFIGDSIRFECGMKVDSAALSGADWAPARFDVTGSFIFTTKLDGISFTVEGSKEATQAASISCGICRKPNTAGTACDFVASGIQGDCASGYVCNGAGSCEASSPPPASPAASDFVN